MQTVQVMVRGGAGRGAAEEGRAEPLNGRRGERRLMRTSAGGLQKAGVWEENREEAPWSCSRSMKWVPPSQSRQLRTIFNSDSRTSVDRTKIKN